MNMKLLNKITLLLSAAVVFAACSGGDGKKDKDGKKVSTAAEVEYSKAVTPDFNADSAYRFIEEQLAFGFRHPGTDGHKRCADYLVATMSRWCDTVVVQDFKTKLWNGQNVDGKNIIASFNPEKANRVMLAAHWDSRQWADHDPDTSRRHSPLLGANDGASGVGVLMEMARVMSAMRPDVGVDFIFFDVEDQGVPEWADRNQYGDDTWCLGSQYWATNPHTPLYNAQYGILFDMVGTSEPRFTKEYFSMYFATGLMNKMWSCASQLGYGNVFVNMPSDPIMDDHYYVNTIRRLPTVDIVQNSVNCSFYTHWHTVGDNLDAVDPNTLKIVGTVTMKVLYTDFPSAKQ